MSPNHPSSRDVEEAVLVVGAGPVGLTLALGLARGGGACGASAGRGGPTTVPRATELPPRPPDLPDASGRPQEFLAAGRVMREAPFSHDGPPVARLCVEGIDSPFPAKLVLPQ